LKVTVSDEQANQTIRQIGSRAQRRNASASGGRYESALNPEERGANASNSSGKKTEYTINVVVKRATNDVTEEDLLRKEIEGLQGALAALENLKTVVDYEARKKEYSRELFHRFTELTVLMT
jgi:hypothetical protein